MKSLTLVRVNLGAEHKQLQFPVSLLDNNATPAGWGVTPWRTKKRMEGFMLDFHKTRSQKKIYCLCTNSWQTLATPLILSPVIQKAMSQDLTLSWNWLARTIGDIIYFFFIFAFQGLCLQVLWPFMLRSFWAHILVLRHNSSSSYLWKNTMQILHDELQLLIL